MQIKKILIAGSMAAMFTTVLAVNTAEILPTAEGGYLQWTPKSGSTHYTMVDEASCNGTTDYVSTTVTGNRDSYQVSLSSVPDGSTITNIAVYPCASKNKSSGSSVMNVFYRLDGVDSSDQGAYSLTGTTPSALSATNFSSLSIVKASTTALQIGAVYSSGTGGARLGRLSTVITYTPTAPASPSNLVSIVSTTTPRYVISNWTDNSNNESSFIIERSLDGINFSVYSSTTANFTMSTDFAVATGTTYYYRVKAVNSGGSSGYSNTTTVTP